MQGRWVNNLEYIFQLLVRHIAVLCGIQLLQQEIIVLHEVKVIIYAQEVILQLLETADLRRIHIDSFLEYAVANYICELLEIS